MNNTVMGTRQTANPCGTTQHSQTQFSRHDVMSDKKKWIEPLVTDVCWLPKFQSLPPVIVKAVQITRCFVTSSLCGCCMCGCGRIHGFNLHTKKSAHLNVTFCLFHSLTDVHAECFKCSMTSSTTCDTTCSPTEFTADEAPRPHVATRVTSST